VVFFVYGLARTLAFALSPSISDLENVTRGGHVGDIIANRKHILATQPLTDGFGLLAGDINRDGSLNVIDIVGMRNVILGRDLSFSQSTIPEGDDVWRFSPSGVVFGDPLNPWADLSDTYFFDGITQPWFNLDFNGVKLGDVNGDWRPPAP